MYRQIFTADERLSDEALLYMASNPNTLSRALTAKRDKPWITYSGSFQILAEDKEATVATVTADWIDWSTVEDRPKQNSLSNISIKWTRVVDEEFTTPVIAEFPRRHGPIIRNSRGDITSPEDLTHHEGGDIVEGVEAQWRGEAGLWKDMKVIFEAHSMGTLDDVTEAFIDRFKSNKGGTYSNRVLSSVVANTPEFKNTVKYVGEQLEAALKKVGMQIENIDVKDIPLQQSERPKFSGYKATGLTILLNDTETTQLHIEDFQIIDAKKGKWEATLGVKIIDHFGLNREDVLKFQSFGTKFWPPLVNPSGPGFSAWYLLQHLHGYKPFQTEIFIRARIGN